MPSDGFSECFTGVSVGEVEWLTPAPFVEDCCQVVVGIDERFVFLVAFVCFVRWVEAVVFVNAIFYIAWASQAFLLFSKNKNNHRKLRKLRKLKILPNKKKNNFAIFFWFSISSFPIQNPFALSNPIIFQSSSPFLFPSLFHPGRLPGNGIVSRDEEKTQWGWPE